MSGPPGVLALPSSDVLGRHDARVSDHLVGVDRAEQAVESAVAARLVGKLSDAPPFALAHSPAMPLSAWEQWIAMPSKSAVARSPSLAPSPSLSGPPAVFDQFANVACGELVPNTLPMSPVALVSVFSNSMLAMLNAPTSQPARVNGTQGAGVLAPPVVTRFGRRSDALTGSVQ